MQLPINTDSKIAENEMIAYMQHLNTFSSTHCAERSSSPSVQTHSGRDRRKTPMPLYCLQSARSAVQQHFQVAERSDSPISQRLQGDDARWHKNHSIHKNNKNKKMHIRFPIVYAQQTIRPLRHTKSGTSMGPSAQLCLEFRLWFCGTDLPA